MTTRGMTLGFLFTILAGLMLQAFPSKANTLNSNAQHSTNSINVDDSGKIQQQLALKLLDKVLETSKSFEDLHLKISIKANAADLLWKHNEPRARALLEDAFTSVDLIEIPVNNNGSFPSEYMIRDIRTNLRTDILRLASQRAPDFAKKLVKLAKEPKDGAPLMPGCVGCAGQNEKARQYINLALDAVNAQEVDMARVSRLVKSAIQEGITPTLGLVLRLLRQKAPALSDDLFIQSLSAARRNTSHLAPNVIAFVRYVFPDFGKGVLRPRNQADESMGLTAAASHESIKAFLIFVSDHIREQSSAVQLAGGNNEDKSLNRKLTYDYFIGEQLLPYVEKYLPDELADMRAHLRELITAIPSAQVKEYLDEFNRERDSKALVKDAATAPKSETRENPYTQAIFMSLNEGNIDQALTIISKLDDEDAKSFYETKVQNRRVAAAMNKGDLSAAYNYAKEISPLHDQAALIGSIALSFYYKGEKDRAQELITEAESLFQKAEDGTEKAIEMINFAYYSEQINPGKGLRNLKSMVEAINAAEIPTTWISYKPIISRSTGKVIMMTYSGLGIFNFDIGFQSLARTDFNQALQLAQEIRHREASVLAQLAICRAVLN